MMEPDAVQKQLQEIIDELDAMDLSPTPLHSHRTSVAREEAPMDLSMTTPPLTPRQPSVAAVDNEESKTEGENAKVAYTLQFKVVMQQQGQEQNPVEEQEAQAFLYLAAASYPCLADLPD